MIEHAAAVVTPQQERGELLHAVCKLAPLQRSSGQGARIHHLEQLGAADTRVRQASDMSAMVVSGGGREAGGFSPAGR